MKNKILGTIIILIGLFWSWYYGHMVFDHFYYGNQFIYCFRPPIHTSVINTILGGLGILVGIKTYQNRIKSLTTFSIIIVFFILGFITDHYGYLLF